MGGPGSILGWLLLPVAFVVLVAVRLASLALGTKKPEAVSAKKEKVVRMNKARTVLSATSETMWALGGSMLAGLPLLT